jgi:hypothetical protein
MPDGFASRLPANTPTAVMMMAPGYWNSAPDIRPPAAAAAAAAGAVTAATAAAVAVGDSLKVAKRAGHPNWAEVLTLET